MLILVRLVHEDLLWNRANIYINSRKNAWVSLGIINSFAISATDNRKAQREIEQAYWQGLHLLTSRRDVSINGLCYYKLMSSFILLGFFIYSVCSHEAPIKYFSLNKRTSQDLGTIWAETQLVSSFRFSVTDDTSTALAPEDYSERLDDFNSELTAQTTISKPMYKVS